MHCVQVSLYEDRCTWTARTTRQLGQRFCDAFDVERRMNLQSKKFQRDNYRVIVAWMLALKNRVRTTPPLARVVQHPSRGAHLSQPPRLHTRPHMTRERTSTVLDSMCLRHKSNSHSLQILPPSRRPPLQPSCAPLHGSPSSLPRISAQTPVCRPCVWRTGAGLLPLPTPRHVPTVWPRLQARPIPTERAAVRPPTVLLSACCPRAVHALSTRCPYVVRTLSAR